MAKRRKPKQRRGHGTGYIRTLPNGRTQAHYPKPGGGYFVKRCDTETEAAQWLADLAEREKGALDLTGGQQTVESWLNRWLAIQEADADYPLKAKTLADYRFKLGYPIDLLGKHVLAELKHDHTDDALRLMRKNLSQNTVDQIRNLLWRAMEEATTRGYIERNPVSRPKRRPRRRKAHDTKRRNVYHLSTTEAGKLLAAVQSRPEYLAWWLLLVLGIREGEVLGLRRSDFDLEHATFRIAQQYTQLNGRAHKDTPKTEYSERTLPFPRALVPAVELYFATLTTRAAKATKRGTWQEHQLVFPGKSGRPMNPSSLLHILKRALQPAGLPSLVNVHHLRHTANRFYTSLGAPDIVRGAIAGHSPKTITDHYGKPDIDTLRPWVEQVHQMLVGEVERARKTG